MIRILRRNDARVRDVRYAMCEENVEQILRHPRCVVGADGTYRWDYPCGGVFGDFYLDYFLDN